MMRVAKHRPGAYSYNEMKFFKLPQYLLAWVVVLCLSVLGGVFVANPSAYATAKTQCTITYATAHSSECTSQDVVDSIAAYCNPASNQHDADWPPNGGDDCSKVYAGCTSDSNGTYSFGGGDICGPIRAAVGVASGSGATTGGGSGGSSSGGAPTNGCDDSSYAEDVPNCRLSGGTDDGSSGSSGNGSSCSVSNPGGCTYQGCHVYGFHWTGSTPINGACELCPTNTPTGVACLPGNKDSALPCPAGVNYDAEKNTCADGTTPNVVCSEKSCDIIKKYIIPFIQLLSAGVGVVVVISIVIGGIQYGSAGGDPAKVSAAKKRIRNAIIALVAYLFLYAFLNFIIPGGFF